MIRRATPADDVALGQLMFDAVRFGDSPYSDAARAAWMPRPNVGQHWSDRLAVQDVFVADMDGSSVGMISLRNDGYIDLLFIHPDARGNGYFQGLFAQVQEIAQELGMAHLWTHASLMAEGPFLAVGFREVKREQIDLSGERLDRCVMEKALILG
jgi:putative acetyltransferase